MKSRALQIESAFHYGLPRIHRTVPCPSKTTMICLHTDDPSSTSLITRFKASGAASSD